MANDTIPSITEFDWLHSNDPWSMLHFLQRANPSERKARFFNAAICRRFWDYLPRQSQELLLESERIADGMIPRPANDMELCGRANAVVAPFDRQYPKKDFPTRELRIQRDAAAAVCYAVIPRELWGAVSYFWELDPTEKLPHCTIIRDIWGNPFHPVVIHSSWLTPVVANLAQVIYNERAFDRLRELADTLEKSGCHEIMLLTHCRSDGPHVRGCWVLDLLLGKE